MVVFPKNKYRNEKTGGHTSKLEGAVAQLYWLRLKAGEIAQIEEQVHTPVCGPTGHPCSSHTKIVYIVDFKLTRPDKSFFYGEAKGFQTDVYRLKRRLWMHHEIGQLEVWGGHWSCPSLIEVIG